MISQGKYPFKETQAETEFTPRVSDGVIELDAKGYVRFASPNSVSVLSRLKVDQVEGKSLEWRNSTANQFHSFFPPSDPNPMKYLWQAKQSL